ncbi:hypothetical protein SLS60_003427 [Paraconiothyrium brasiliense]|uniref:Uncharacterized protein n=1 Tax=Paraconiothyrium brasiliense TaxID=300254 RepID=A0ABR3RVN3_9PLEO
MTEYPSLREDPDNDSELSTSTSFVWGNRNLLLEGSTVGQGTANSIQEKTLPDSPHAILQEANQELSLNISQDLHPSPASDTRTSGRNLPYSEHKSYQNILQRSPQGAISNAAGKEGSHFFIGLDEHATMLLNGFSTYEEFYRTQGSKGLPKAQSGNKSNPRVDFDRASNTTGASGHSPGRTGTRGRPRPGSTDTIHLHPNQDSDTTTQEQMAAVMHEANENVMMYSLRTPSLADKLHQNIQNAQFLWIMRDTPPYDILDMYIFFETKIVQDWNAIRLGERVPNDDSLSVLDQDPSFPLRWAAIKNGVKIRQQRPVVQSTALQTSAQHGDKHYVRATTLVGAGNTLPEGLSRPLYPQPKPVIQEASSPLDPVNFAIEQEESDQKSKTNGPNARQYDLLQFAPSANVPFPKAGTQANVTAVELMVFFPRYLQSTDVIDRLISNGGTSAVFAHIVNAHRVLKGTSLAQGNYFYSVMKVRMRKRGPTYSDWTVSDHSTLPGHNSSNLNIAGLHTAGDVRANSTNLGISTADRNHGSIQFKDLANHVKKLPSGFDALDLTRCIEYAMAHPTRSWEYPDDFERLVTHIGGPSQIQPEHYDRAAFQRW